MKAMPVSVTNQQDKIKISRDTVRALKAAIGLVLAREGVPAKTEVGLTLVNDGDIHELNRQYRGVDRPTDVLSFALNDPGEMADPEETRAMLGDVVVSTERALAQSEEYGHSLSREICYLAVHGTLHLLGYDHESPKEQAVMREKEEGVLRSLGLDRESP